MLVQMPLSHTSPASHSSTSAGHEAGSEGQHGDGLGPLPPFSRLCLWAWSTGAEASGAEGKRRTLPPPPCGALCPSDRARCCQGPWAMSDSKELKPHQPSSILS